MTLFLLSCNFFTPKTCFKEKVNKLVKVASLWRLSLIEANKLYISKFLSWIYFVPLSSQVSLQYFNCLHLLFSLSSSFRICLFFYLWNWYIYIYIFELCCRCMWRLQIPICMQFRKFLLQCLKRFALCFSMAFRKYMHKFIGAIMVLVILPFNFVNLFIFYQK